MSTRRSHEVTQYLAPTRSFVLQMTSNTSDAVIVRSTVDLGRNLGLRVVAEGVEDPLTLQELDALGCDAVQGYHVSRPVPPRRPDQLARAAGGRAPPATLTAPWACLTALPPRIPA
jgi:EAL domain-containing protein (putative c-di-GMP-specific phosphodiesterase class I)